MRTILILSLILAGCQAPKHIERYTDLKFLDFRKYSDKGFLFTPDKYYGPYYAIGPIEYCIIPGAYYKVVKGGFFTEPKDTSKWIKEKITVGQVIDGLYDICIDLGADALIDFRITEEKVNSYITLKGYRISGLAIKRE